MKSRVGFVSNSSSCSFLVISPKSEKVDFAKGYKGRTINVPQTFGGNTEFGRECTNYTTFGDRLNFALLMAENWDFCCTQNGIPSKKDLFWNRDDYWKDHEPSNYKNLVAMVRRVVANELETDDIRVYMETDTFDGRDNHFLNSFVKDKDDDMYRDWCYIDHGSNWSEMPCNLQIFDSDQNLHDFLFRKGSRVCNRGDEYEYAAEKLEDGEWATTKHDRGGDE